MARRIESHLLPGPAGKLEALLEEPEENEPALAALVCHPHPLHGGTMHNKVVHRIARGLRTAGAAVLRFNFRGVSRSEGSYGNGAGELEDARAALAWLRDGYPALPWLLAGFSFGSRIILRLGCEAPGAARLIAVGFPTRSTDTESYLAACPAERVFVQSTRDQYGPQADLQAFFDRADGPKRLIWVSAEDHFFNGGLEELEAVVRGLAAAS